MRIVGWQSYKIGSKLGTFHETVITRPTCSFPEYFCLRGGDGGGSSAPQELPSDALVPVH